jgi:hypothetical protein
VVSVAELALHQICFYWARPTLLGGQGVGPVATSLDREALQVWYERLRPVVWAAAAPAELAEPGLDLVYVTHGPEAALLHRLRTMDPEGRASTLTHCLIGPARQLRPWDAIGLAGASFWITQPEQIPADGRLPQWILDPPARAESSMGTPPELLEALVGRLLADPSARLSVIVPPVPGVALLSDLTAILDGALASPLTFATRMERDTESGPQVIVLDQPPTASMTASAYHSTTAEDRRALPGELGTFSHALVDAFQTGGRAWARDWQVGPPLVASSADTEAWLGRLRLAAGVFGTASSILHRALVDPAGPEAAFLTTRRGLEMASGLLSSVSDEELAGVISGADRGPFGSGYLQLAVNRCLPEDGHRPSPALLAATAGARVGPRLVRDRLRVVVSARANRKVHPSDRIARCGDALALGLAPDTPEIEAELGDVSARSLVYGAWEEVRDRPDYALRLLRRAATHRRLERGRREMDKDRVLAPNGVLAATIASFANRGTVDARTGYRLAVDIALGRSIRDPRPVYRVLREYGFTPVPPDLAAAVMDAIDPRYADDQLRYELGRLRMRRPPDETPRPRVHRGTDDDLLARPFPGQHPDAQFPGQGHQIYTPEFGQRVYVPGSELVAPLAQQQPPSATPPQFPPLATRYVDDGDGDGDDGPPRRFVVILLVITLVVLAFLIGLALRPGMLGRG